MTTLHFDQRFQGPPRSTNGGYAAGSLVAAAFGVDEATYEVRLSAPPRLDAGLEVVHREDRAELLDGDRLVAAAARSERELAPVAWVERRVAGAAESTYPGLLNHPFGRCFGCGPGAQQGLKIFPGEVTPAAGGARRVAASWTTLPSLPTADAGVPGTEGTEGTEDERVSLAVAWTALDCASGWAAHIEETPIVLGSMTARVTRLPSAHAKHVVVAEERGREGRRVMTAASVYDDEGELLGTAEHVWIAVDPADFA